jgi:hypothetical protein
MSRYQIAVHPAHLATMPRAEGYVGWDTPLQTFFGQVLDPDRPEGEPEAVFWIGASDRHCPDLVAFAQAMQPWAPIPMRVLALLAQDRDQSPPPTALQRRMIDLFSTPYAPKGS